MGQYHKPVNLDKKEFINPHTFNDGIKMLEFGASDCGTLTGADKASCETRSKTALAKDAVADTVITTKVKTELMAQPALKSLDVKVETNNGAVVLSGFVPSKAEADKAVDVARNVKGVTDVKNSLRIK